MNLNVVRDYLGHESQLCGVEEHRLVGGKGDGQRIYEVHTAAGLDLTVSPDRNGDITRLRYEGVNLSYMSPCGYVAPAYYDSTGTNWLQSFTAGFLTTCGLQNVGTPNTDDGEELPMHGSVTNLPAEHAWWTESEDAFEIHTVTKDETIFGRKLRLERLLTVSKTEPCFWITDTISNTGGERQPFEVLYHMNMGYPLLDEDSIITIPSVEVTPRDEHAAEEIAHWETMEKPTPAYQECCYFHRFEEGAGFAGIYQPKLQKGLEIRFDAEELDGFVEWKMMGVRDYVLGLECGNCLPDGRAWNREHGMLKFLEPGESKTYTVQITLTKSETE